MSKKSGSLSAILLLAGATVGAAASLLWAPHSGYRTRRKLRRKIDHGCEYLSVVGQDISDASQELIERGRDAAARVMDRGLLKKVA